MQEKEKIDKKSVTNKTNKKTYSKKTYNKRVRTTEVEKRSKKINPIKIAFLGGLNEVGKNMTLYEYENDMIIVDCGLTFPDQDMPGIDFVIPDFSYVEKNKDKIKGIVITHGHEDHIGGLAYLLKEINAPIYATELTVGLISVKLEEHGLQNKVKMNVKKPGNHIKLGKFDVELIHVNHSIPGAVGLAIKTPAGIIVQTGDFKIDTTPIDGDMTDLARFSELGKEGVLCLLADSTNAERSGISQSEKIVGEAFDVLFRKAGNKRILVATFASNIHRIQQIIDVAKSLGRKVALSGRSMENVVEIGCKLGYLTVPEGVLIDISMINRYTPEELVIITTGSQGEPMSALTRMALSDHRNVEITSRDYVIVSAKPIPGNEKTVGRVIDELLKLGAEVVYERMYDVHVSGHACQEELKLLMALVKPKFFIPVHGEQKHLRTHANIAESIGINKKNILIAGIGDLVELSDKRMKVVDSVPSGRILVDGYGVGDVGSIVLRDRKHLAQDGLIIIVATVDCETNEILSGPDIVSRGFVYVRESEELIDEARMRTQDIVEKYTVKNIRDWAMIKSKVRDEVSKLMYERTKRSPMILPIFMEV